MEQLLDTGEVGRPRRDADEPRLIGEEQAEALIAQAREHGVELLGEQGLLRQMTRRLCLVGSGSHGSRLTAESSFVRVKGRRERRQAARVLAALSAAPRANSAESDDVVERDHIVEGDSRSRKPRIVAALVLRNQPISTRRVAGYNVYLEGPALVSGRGDRRRSASIRARVDTPRPLPGFLLGLGATLPHFALRTTTSA